ncbi:uncharacterized protein LOC124166731 [Ischnura elegans]|uniref:uncharacterized protein LOC124166731 n=1 Tax=Ischnura elegans TaxID=197161 RepID=UPI001ED8839B|nr:uncharacterized protein LOC124166731 [Ischnura elegans]
MVSIPSTLRFHASLSRLILIFCSVTMVSPSVIIDFESNGLQKCYNGFGEWVRVDNDYLVSKGVKPFENSTGYIVPQQGAVIFVCGVTDKVTLAGIVNVKIRLWASYKGAAAVYVIVKVNTVPVYFTQLTNGEWSTVNKSTESVPEGQYQIEIQGLAGNEILILDEIEISSDAGTKAWSRTIGDAYEDNDDVSSEGNEDWKYDSEYWGDYNEELF